MAAEAQEGKAVPPLERGGSTPAEGRGAAAVAGPAAETKQEVRCGENMFFFLREKNMFFSSFDARQIGN